MTIRDCLVSTAAWRLAGLLIVVLVWSGLALDAQRGLTQWDGVYSAAQARRAETMFMERCAYCHRDEATGGQQILITPAPALAGSEFARKWDGRSLEYLVTTIHATMPQWEGGTLSRQQAVDLVAFILQEGAYPSGAVELPADADTLEAITFTAVKVR